MHLRKNAAKSRTAAVVSLDGLQDPDTGRIPLGDMVISVERARAQAQEYGHSFDRECAYLTCHSMLHLLGYDHIEPAEAAVMEQKQEEILNRLGITRNE